MTRCRRRRRERSALGGALDATPALDAPDARAEICALSPPVERALERAAQGLPPVVVLVDIEEMSYKDAARRLGVPVGTVMSRAHRGRRTLADGDARRRGPAQAA